MTEEESFTKQGLMKDVESLLEISRSWREKMEYLPADREFAMFRRAVTCVEKAIMLVEKILGKFIKD